MRPMIFARSTEIRPPCPEITRVVGGPKSEDLPGKCKVTGPLRRWLIKYGWGGRALAGFLSY